jgi:hypothetical protein
MPHAGVVPVAAMRRQLELSAASLVL